LKIGNQMPIEKGKIIIIVTSIAFFIVFGGLIGLYLYEKQYNPLLGGGNGENLCYHVNITINYSNGTINTYHNINGTNVLNLTKSVALVDPHPQYGSAFVFRINNYAVDPFGENLWWVYTLNGISAGGVTGTYPQNHSIIVWTIISN